MSLHLPLEGVKIVEFEGIGPGPMAGLILAGMGAEVTVLARPAPPPRRSNPLREGKRIVTVDLKAENDRMEALALIGEADALIEGNRPGVMERLGLSPEVCLSRNPRLVYGRMTGWGQSGPLAHAAGHDLNYVALTGLLSLAVPAGQRPTIPPTVIGDAGGSLGLAFGIACALFDVRGGGGGRVVDAAILDIAAMLGTLAHYARSIGLVDGPKPSAFHGSPYYDSYQCSDGKFVTVCAAEPQFYDQFLDACGLSDVDRAQQNVVSQWPALKERIAKIFRQKTRDEWCEYMEGTDICFAPVLSMDEAATHPHNVARGLFRAAPDSDGMRPAVAPRFVEVVVHNDRRVEP